MNLNKFKNAFEHAFKISDGKEHITEEDHKLLEKVAKFIVRRRLATPATLFIETVRPMNFVGSSIMTFFRPILGLLLNLAEYDRLTVLLEKRCCIDLIIEEIDKEETNYKLSRGKYVREKT